MRILALSDVHGDREFIKKMAQKGKNEAVDLVILAGDLASHDGNIDGMVGPFREQNLEVAIIPGNHEGLAEVEFLCERYGATNLHGYILKKGTVGIFGCGYGDVGIHQLTEEDFAKTLEKTHNQLGNVKTKVMLTHVQPTNSVVALNWPGSTAVREAIHKFQPDIHICGHIHETHGIEETIGNTRVMNVGKTGKIIDIPEL